MPTLRPHPIVQAAAVVVVMAAAAGGVWAGLMGGPPRPQPVAAAALDAQQGAALFEQRCTRCHTVGGGDRSGPDLATAALGRDPDWLRAMVASPDSMFRMDSLARWVLDVHDFAPADTTADAENPDLRALAAFLATFDPSR